MLKNVGQIDRVPLGVDEEPSALAGSHGHAHQAPFGESIDEPATLADHEGKALLIVDVASLCQLAGQYEGLQALHQRFAPRGFSVLGFPCKGPLPATAVEPGEPAPVTAAVSRSERARRGR